MRLLRIFSNVAFFICCISFAVFIYRTVYTPVPDLPVIYAITPTYKRATQKCDLTRLAITLRQVPSLHWIVVEDCDSKTKLVTNLLKKSGVQYTHLNVSTPSWCKPKCVARGTEQRNMGIDWLMEYRGPEDSGVVYFADDDNTYSLELFEEMRFTKWVSVWPVGLVAGGLYERPVVENGHVVGWFSNWLGGRKFPIDMAGFGVNLQLILSNPRARFKLVGAQPSRQETDFLNRITKIEELEPKANNCTEVLVWHTRTQTPYVAAKREANLTIEV